MKTEMLTLREKGVLRLIANELTIDEIASDLCVSTHTVISHRKNIKSKMKVKNTAGMIRRAFELGYLLI